MRNMTHSGPRARVDSGPIFKTLFGLRSRTRPRTRTRKGAGLIEAALLFACVVLVGEVLLVAFSTAIVPIVAP